MIWHIDHSVHPREGGHGRHECLLMIFLASRQQAVTTPHMNQNQDQPGATDFLVPPEECHSPLQKNRKTLPRCHLLQYSQNQ